jgi:hypothetical protein
VVIKAASNFMDRPSSVKRATRTGAGACESVNLRYACRLVGGVSIKNLPAAEPLPRSDSSLNYTRVSVDSVCGKRHASVARRRLSSFTAPFDLRTFVAASHQNPSTLRPVTAASRLVNLPRLGVVHIARRSSGGNGPQGDGLFGATVGDGN